VIYSAEWILFIIGPHFCDGVVVLLQGQIEILTRCRRGVVALVVGVDVTHVYSTGFRTIRQRGNAQRQALVLRRR